MQPEFAATTPPSANDASRLPQAWRSPLASLTIMAFVLLVLTAREWSEMFHQWWNIDTYSHILLIPPVIIWLVALKRRELAKITPQSWLPGLAIIAAALGLWIAGRASGINLLAHAGAVGSVQGVIITAIGLRASLALALPICFAVFLVPFGDEIIPPLQAITASIAVTLTEWSGVPAVVDGIYIDTPIGLFIVAEACSGVKFLIAMIALAVLICFTRFERWSHRAGFMAISIVVPILANGVRAWATIYIAQSQGIEFAAGFDHIFYGWVFFALVIAVVLAGAWRWFDRDPRDYGWTAEEVDNLALAQRIAQPSVSAVVIVAGMAAIVLAALIIEGYVTGVVGQPAFV